MAGVLDSWLGAKGVAVRLGGLVIHGNDAETLPRCLESLLAVCDEVVAVDSCSTDGSAELVKASGARRVLHPWEGYGAARARGAQELSGCDYLLFLDADEHLEPEAIAVLRGWRESAPSHPFYTLRIRDWAELPERRFLYRLERHIRLVRRDAATTWKAEMIVHEALPRRLSLPLAAQVEHAFARSLEERRGKNQRYALLWALRSFLAGRRARKLAPLQRAWHAFRDLALKGALFRGGTAALRLAWAVSAYHAQKYVYLRQLERGLHPELTRALREGRRAELFLMLKGYPRL